MYSANFYEFQKYEANEQTLNHLDDFDQFKYCLARSNIV